MCVWRGLISAARARGETMSINERTLFPYAHIHTCVRESGFYHRRSPNADGSDMGSAKTDKWPRKLRAEREDSKDYLKPIIPTHSLSLSDKPLQFCC